MGEMVFRNDCAEMPPTRRRGFAIGFRLAQQRRRTLVAWLLFASAAASWGEPYQPSQLDMQSATSRLAAFTDIGNEPDDQMSLIRLLLYGNEIDIEALVATTSTWQCQEVRPDILHQIVSGYAKVRDNLTLHAAGWPSAEEIASRIATGPAGYGMAALTDRSPSSGALALIHAADKDDPRPLWVSIWGGANTLMEALRYVRATRTPQALEKFVASLRVYSISDQDDADPRIRREFPGLPYIVSPTPPNGEEYVYATWTGIAGDVCYRNGAGADTRLVTNNWLSPTSRPVPLRSADT